MRPAGRDAVSSRHQQVLDLGNPDVNAHILGRLRLFVDQLGVSHLKWDHNRDLLEAEDRRSQRPAVHRQTTATYRLLDWLRECRPDLTVESSSSGGARADLGILDRADLIWTSDSLDPVERASVERWTSLVFPPEVMGSHVGSSPDLSTGRMSTLGMRAAGAALGSMGVELDLATLSDNDLATLCRWISFHREVRSWLRCSRLYQIDGPVETAVLRCFVAQDRAHALLDMVAVSSTADAVRGCIRIPGLDPAAWYEISLVAPEDLIPHIDPPVLPPWTGKRTVVPGLILGSLGLRLPNLPGVLRERVGQRRSTSTQLLGPGARRLQPDEWCSWLPGTVALRRKASPMGHERHSRNVTYGARATCKLRLSL